MTRRPIDEQLITDFLLGNLPEEEIEQLDEMSLADDDFANRLQVVENDLVDAYVKGELSGTTLAQFKSNYLRSSKRQEKVAFAETLQKITKRSTIAPQQRTLYQSPWLAVAAAVVLLTLSYLIFQNIRLQNQVETMRAEKQSFQQRELELQKQKAQLEHQSISNKPPEVKLMAFVLLPQTRGINKIPMLRIPVGTDSIALTLKFEVNEYAMYQTALKDPATDKVIWESDNVKADTNNSVQVQIPASLLRPQNYLMELSGISANRTAEIVSSYPFRISSE